MTRQLALDLGSRPAFGREDFLVADSNREALAWLDRWRDWPAPGLVLHGPAGCGKTHLAHVWCGMAGARIIQAADLAHAHLPDLIGPAVVIEDADRSGIEAPLLHFYNLTVEHAGRLLLTARGAPPRWPTVLPDLRSRLNALPAVAVKPPDDMLMAAVLVKLFADRQVQVPQEVIGFLLGHMERSFAAARRVVEAADSLALAEQRRLTVPLVRRVLQDMGEAGEEG